MLKNLVYAISAVSLATATVGVKERVELGEVFYEDPIFREASAQNMYNPVSSGVKDDETEQEKNFRMENYAEGGRRCWTDTIGGSGFSDTMRTSENLQKLYNTE